ncbi:unnamed protein product [Rhizoctonia solani]|uniref:Nephrocystin 3-like N-terminal domain-containing protein n=1 Tax=Rhizoctonia solani TaxID=456999 RepID=A0A8H3DE48_9AGAM|nr:unnamed protein product [Rhizoctonia solani]
MRILPTIRTKSADLVRGLSAHLGFTVYTVCKQLDNEKRLGASFFCSRNSPGRRDVNRIMPTIAYQLARLSGEYWDELFLALNNRIDAAKLTLEEQFQEWIVRPLLKARHTVPTDTIIVIDALDECLDSYGARDILNLLSKYPGKLPIKFFLTCNHLTEGNDVRQRIPQDRFRMALQVYDIENSIGRTDIKSYLSGELASMQLPSGDIDALCALAGRQFIFAVVAARYVPSGASITDNLRRLSIVLNLGADSGDNTRTKMDDLYFSILSDTPDGTDLKQEEVVMRRQVLQTLTYMSEPVTTNLLVGLLDLENQHSLHLILEPLRPLLYLNSTTGVISIRHASFAEFLFDPMRSGRFHSSEKEHHEQMAARCFQLMHQLLRFNICGLEGPAQVDKDVLDLLARVEKVVPPALFYACRNWEVHLQRSEQLSNLIPCLNDFFQHKLLFWMEVMNLKGCINHGATVLLQAQDWLSAQVKANRQLKQDETVRKDHVGIKLLKFSQDAHKFIRAYAGSPMSLSTPHIYLSALPSLSTKNPIYKAYRPQMNDNLIELRGPGMKGRRIAPISEWSTGAMVNCLALSTDGTRIAAGLHNGKVGIWNTDGKPLIKPQSVGKGPVNVVAFSPDGRDVASGYERDSTIHIWNTKSGKGAQILALNEQHQCNRTNSISFSPDGARFVSASDGTKIYVWDMRAGRTVGGILERHQKAVTSVLFFHDNRRIASASDDCTIFIWDSLTGEVECGPFEGHTEGILSIGLSPDNTHLVSGGRDYTIRVWDVASGMLHAGPFESHTMDITSVAFSPNGRQIVSGSWDKTVRIWDSGNGKQPSGPYIMNSCWPNCAVFALDGSHVISGSGNRGVCKWSLENNTTSNKIYSNSVIISSVATSPDGSRVVAGFWDGTISIWDAQDGSLIIGPRQEHNAAIMSVSWSPNGKYIATASADCTVCFWDVDTQSIARLCPKKGHAGPVLCVSFSPDNTHAVSGSQDSTIKTWILQLRDDSSKLQFFEARLIESHTSAVHSVTFSFDSLQIVSASSDQTVRLWSAYTGRLLMVFRGHNTEVTTAAISTDGQKIISGATDGTIIAWDVDSGLPHANLPFKGHTASIRSISFSLDNTLVVSGSDDGAVSLWDARSGVILIPPIREHSDKMVLSGFGIPLKS